MDFPDEVLADPCVNELSSPCTVSSSSLFAVPNLSPPSSSYSVAPSVRHISPCLSSSAVVYSPISSPEELDMDSVAGLRGSDDSFEEEEGLDGQVETDVQMSDIEGNLPLIPIPHPSSPSNSVSSASGRSLIEEVDVNLSARRAMIPTVAGLVRVMGSFAPVMDIVRVASQLPKSIRLWTWVSSN